MMIFSNRYSFDTLNKLYFKIFIKLIKKKVGKYGMLSEFNCIEQNSQIF